MLLLISSSGGMDYNLRRLDTTELISFSPPNSSIGPIKLPEPIRYHCSVLIDDKVYVIGGTSKTPDVLKSVYSISIHDGKIANHSDMINKRAKHGCASFKIGNKTLIAVGFGSFGWHKTEIMDVQDNVWFQGSKGFIAFHKC